MKALSLLFAALLASVTPIAFADAEAPFTIGVLRRDGIVIPFAAFDGRDWSMPWPTEPWPTGLRQAGPRQELPNSLETIPSRWWGKSPPAAQWIPWLEGVAGKPIRLQRPQPLTLNCSTRVGIRSDYRSAEPAPLPVEQPYPKDGVVVSGVQTIKAVDILSRGSKAWLEIEKQLVEPFGDAEQRAAAAFTAWDHPWRREHRTAFRVEVEALYRATMDDEGWVAYYVEAVRNYPPMAGDEGCGLVAGINGWIRVPPDGKAKYDLRGRVTYCDRKGAIFLLPLGLVDTGGRTYWLYQTSGYGREWYVVARPTKSEVVYEVEYSAGLCPL